MLDELPASVRQELRASHPMMKRLLRVFAEDSRQSLLIDDVLVQLYLSKGQEVRRATLTQALHHAVERGYLHRVERGRYALADVGRAWLIGS